MTAVCCELERLCKSADVYGGTVRSLIELPAMGAGSLDPYRKNENRTLENSFRDSYCNTKEAFACKLDPIHEKGRVFSDVIFANKFLNYTVQS